MSNKNAIPKIVAEFRHEMAGHGSTFFVIYTEREKHTGRHKVMLTSNSTPEGVGAILAPMLQPKPEAVAMMVKALPKPGWFASKKKREAQAVELLAKLTRMFTLPAIEQKPVEPPKPDIKLV